MIGASDAESRADFEADLVAALGVQRWVAEVAAAAPFASVDELLRAARAAATPLIEAEIDEALAHHPRIGERASGEGAAAAHSRREQANADADAGHLDLAAALADGNAAYEARFGRVFLIRAAGRSRSEIVDELHRRLMLGDASELEVVAEQLREIALLRLASTFDSKEGSR